MDVEMFAGSLRRAADEVVRQAASGAGGYAVHCNVHVLMTAKSDADVMRSLTEAWRVLPDGAPIAWLQRRLGAASAERVGGPDLMPLAINLGRASDLRHAFVGATPETLERLRRRLQVAFPGIRVVGTLAPPFGTPSAWTADVIRQVAAWRPNVVWLALGAPKQELWMRENAASLAPALVLGVGAAFDFLAGRQSRAPRWMQAWGLEWAYRLAAEPRRLGGRYATTNSAFLVHAAALVAGRKRS